MSGDSSQNPEYFDEHGLRMDPWDLNETWGYNQDGLTQEQKALLVEQASKDELDEAKRIMKHVSSDNSAEDTVQRLLHGTTESNMNGSGQNNDYDNFLEQSDDDEEVEYTAQSIEERLEHLDHKYRLDEFTSDLMQHILESGNSTTRQTASSAQHHMNGNTTSSTTHTSQSEEQVPVYMQEGDLPAGVRKGDSSRSTVVPPEKLNEYIPESARGETTGDPAYDADTVEDLLKKLQQQTSTPSHLAQHLRAGKEDVGREDTDALLKSMDAHHSEEPLHVNTDVLQEAKDDDGVNDSVKQWEHNFEQSLDEDKDFRQFRDTLVGNVTREKRQHPG